MRLVYRWLCAFVVTVAVIILLRNIFTEPSKSNEAVDEPSKFQWVNLKGYKKCHNSAQGNKMIADDRGYICDWSDKLSTGCCFPEGVTAKKYVCSSCKKNNCCSIFEHCVSCCQNPDKRRLVESILADSTRKILKKVENQFQFCLVKCRTSSESVIHENHYRNSKYKHCFGNKYPETEP